MPQSPSPSSPQPCLRCVRVEEMIRGEIPRTRLRGVRHRALGLALDDARALAQFLATSPGALAHETLIYVPQGAGQEPLPVFTSGLMLIKYGMWACDHAVGTPDEADALFRVGLWFSADRATFAEAQALLPQLTSPQELALLLARHQEPALPVSPAVRRLLGVSAAA